MCRFRRGEITARREGRVNGLPRIVGLLGGVEPILIEQAADECGEQLHPPAACVRRVKRFERVEETDEQGPTLVVRRGPGGGGLLNPLGSKSLSPGVDLVSAYPSRSLLSHLIGTL